MYSGCVLDQLTWQMQRSGLLTATARLVAQGETVGSTTGVGTPAELELKRFGHFNGAISRNGSALGNIVSAEITYANNLDRIETIRADGPHAVAEVEPAGLAGKVQSDHGSIALDVVDEGGGAHAAQRAVLGGLPVEGCLHPLRPLDFDARARQEDGVNREGEALARWQAVREL
jgi:hypothetical protein